MSVIATIRGQVRGVRDLTRKAEGGGRGDRFARNVSVLTEQDDILGETVGVVAWDNDFGSETFAPGDVVELVVDVQSDKQYGLQAVLKRVTKLAAAKSAAHA